VEQGADTEIADIEHRTPLLVAGYRNHLGSVDVLIELGANLFAKVSFPSCDARSQI